MMNFFLNLFNLINDGSNWDMSIGLNLYWNFLVMNVMLWFGAAGECQDKHHNTQGNRAHQHYMIISHFSSKRH